VEKKIFPEELSSGTGIIFSGSATGITYISELEGKQMDSLDLYTLIK